MGMTVTNNLSTLKGKDLVGYNFTPGSEHILYLEDKAGNESRIRISADLVRIMDQYLDSENSLTKAA